MGLWGTSTRGQFWTVPDLTSGVQPLGGPLEVLELTTAGRVERSSDAEAADRFALAREVFTPSTSRDAAPLYGPPGCPSGWIASRGLRAGQPRLYTESAGEAHERLGAGLIRGASLPHLQPDGACRGGEY